MTKPKKIGIVLLTAGAVLVIAALLLFSHNRAEDRRAGESAEETLRLVEAAMAERGTNGETGTTPAPGDSEPDAAATATNAPGASASPGAAAAGTETGSGGLPAPPALDFPGYGLTMPVAATWSFPAMEISPCRHTGSVYNDNLVVAGHNYKTEFDVLFHLEAGDTVTFTDVDGNVFTYTVREFASVTPDDSDTVMNSGYALTMYTCNWDTSERVTVFCERTGGEIPGENA